MTGTHREIGRRRIASGEEVRTVLIRRRYDAPIQDVWEACTDPERLSRWFLPVTGDLRVGGRFSLQGNAGGEILRCDPQTGLWGVPTGWEVPLAHALPRYLRGELPDAPAVEWYRPTPEDLELGDRCGQAWAAVVEAADRGG
jgi:hypothetical protein